LAAVQAAIARGHRRPDGLILFSPWLDMTLSGRSMSENASSYAMLSVKILTRMRGLYLQGEDPTDRRASPLFDQCLELPPTMLVYSTAEILTADAARFAAKLRNTGTPLTELAAPGKPHVYPLFRMVPGAAAALRTVADFVAKHGAPAPRKAA
ncbi:MAG TPA: alpha/beta hydrolase, partial [Acetobacteraceae bacterium]|nr:alpha/beta hydrolase [Acetobacteraceae bacterium]